MHSVVLFCAEVKYSSKIWVSQFEDRIKGCLCSITAVSATSDDCASWIPTNKLWTKEIEKNIFYMAHWSGTRGHYTSLTSLHRTKPIKRIVPQKMYNNSHAVSHTFFRPTTTTSKRHADRKRGDVCPRIWIILHIVVIIIISMTKYTSKHQRPQKPRRKSDHRLIHSPPPPYTRYMHMRSYTHMHKSQWQWI